MPRAVQGLTFALVFLLAAVATFVYARNDAPSFQHCYSVQYQKNIANTEQPDGFSFFFKKRLAFECTVRFIEVHNAVITAIATVLLTFVTGGLIWAGYQQIRTIRAQLRAYVTTVPGFSIRQGGNRGALKFEFRPQILNTGQTPAYKVDIVSRMAFVAIGEVAKYDFRLPANQYPGAMTLGPNQERFTQVIFDRKLTKAELRLYKKGSHRLLIYGRINYRDAFGHRHYTHYCYIVSWWLRMGPPLWNHAIPHNDSN